MKEGLTLHLPARRPYARDSRSGQAVAQRQHSAQRDLEARGVEVVVLQRVGECGHRVLPPADVARLAQQHVHPGNGPETTIGIGHWTEAYLANIIDVAFVL
jgi:uncharacterized protein YigA (DUF484 family)